MEAFVAFDKAALAEGTIRRKDKELMAIAGALTTQCPYCIELHTNKARETGASDPEIAETLLIAAALRGCGDHLRHTRDEGNLIAESSAVNLHTNMRIVSKTQ